MEKKVPQVKLVFRVKKGFKAHQGLLEKKAHQGLLETKDNWVQPVPQETKG